MFQSKINVGETIFTTMSQLSLQYKATNLGQGFPDYEMDESLIELVDEAMKEGYNQYTHARGAMPLREAISRKISQLYNLPVDPGKNICITPGGTYAIYTALTTILRAGDEVIVFEPAYDSYIPNIILNGAKPVVMQLTLPDFKIDWKQVQEAITPRTRMIIVNQPHNPTGTILSAEDMRELGKIVLENNLYLLSDEVYEHLVYDGKKFESVLHYPELFERTFAVYSLGKVYHCTGWKTGYCLAPQKLMNEFVKVHQFLAFCCFGPVQYALAKFLEEKEHYLKLGDFMQPKRDLLEKYLNEAGFKSLPSSGTFFQLYDYSALSGLGENDFAKKITKEAGVSAIPVSAFYTDKKNQQLLRFCFAKKDQTLIEAGERLKKYFAR